ncbi:hypothetical protein BVX94_03955 [bacterium B17]|nr:hypothetical protein BVX94_03955 [bacterium B17]
MTNVLLGEKKLKDVIHDTKIENVKFITSGKSVTNSAELLQSTDMKALIDGIKDEYDYVMIDTSPVLRVTDTVIVAEQDVGVILYIARANKTPKPMIQYSLEVLRDTQILGLIINSIEMHKISSLYYTYQYPTYAYYSNAYAYGQDYYYDGTGKGGGRKRLRAKYGSGGGMDKMWRDAKRWMRRTFLPMD